MGLYCERVFPALMNRLMDTEQIRRIRARVCAPLSGEVLEIGFGTGLNLPHVPPRVTALLAVEPLERARTLASGRVASSRVPVSFVGSDGQTLALDDGSVDAALSTWTLCSVRDPVAAVREIVRVLRPGGKLYFVEHGCSPERRVLKWQKRFNPVQRRVACGCQLDRDMPSIVEDGGLAIERLATYYLKGDLKILGWTFEGVAGAGGAVVTPIRAPERSVP